MCLLQTFVGIQVKIALIFFKYIAVFLYKPLKNRKLSCIDNFREILNEHIAENRWKNIRTVHCGLIQHRRFARVATLAPLQRSGPRTDTLGAARDRRPRRDRIAIHLLRFGGIFLQLSGGFLFQLLRLLIFAMLLFFQFSVQECKSLRLVLPHIGILVRCIHTWYPSPAWTCAT